MPYKLRCGTNKDAQAMAEVYFASFRLLTFLPMLHTAENYRRFAADVILKECAVTVVEDDTGIVPFLALRGEEVRLLYTRLTASGSGLKGCSSRRRNRAVSKHSNCGACKPTPAPGAFTKPAVFEPCGLRMRRQRRADAPRPLSVGASWKLEIPKPSSLDPMQRVANPDGAARRRQSMYAGLGDEQRPRPRRAPRAAASLSLPLRFHEHHRDDRCRLPAIHPFTSGPPHLRQLCDHPRSYSCWLPGS